jgi:hypothetical protein
MKYLKKYKLFLEEDEFEINDSDTIDVKMSKEKLNDLKSDFTEYNQKKNLIDNVFKNNKDKPELIESELKKILGTESEERNPFLVEYTHVAKSQYEIDKLHDDNVKDKLRQDDFRQELSLAKEDSTKVAVNSKIQDITNRIAGRNKKILDIQKDITERDKEHKEKMKKMDDESKEYIKNISSPGQK